MVIKLLNNTITACEKKAEGYPEKFKCELIMNSDSTATLKFKEFLDYKELDLLELILRLGDAD